MSVLSTVSWVSCALLSAVSAFTIVTAAGCGTDAKGVDDCREIEDARCTADKNCGLSTTVSECQTFYRDQCLHGLPVTPPASTAIKSCVATIRAAGVCALQGMDTALSDCANAPTGSATSAQTACEIVANPEKTSECSFLMPTADSGSGGTGGTGGTGGSAGSGGSAGATDVAGAAGAAGASGAAG